MAFTIQAAEQTDLNLTTTPQRLEYSSGNPLVGQEFVHISSASVDSAIVVYVDLRRGSTPTSAGTDKAPLSQLPHYFVCEGVTEIWLSASAATTVCVTVK